MWIGGAQTCPGAPGLQAKECLLEEGRLGPRQDRRTEVRGCRVSSGGLDWGRTFPGPGQARQEQEAWREGASTSLQPPWICCFPALCGLSRREGAQERAWGVGAIHGDPTMRATLLGKEISQGRQRCLEAG